MDKKSFITFFVVCFVGFWASFASVFFLYDVFIPTDPERLDFEKTQKINVHISKSWKFSSGAKLLNLDFDHKKISIDFLNSDSTASFISRKTKVSPGDKVMARVNIKGSVGADIQLRIVRHCTRNKIEGTRKIVKLNSNFQSVDLKHIFKNNHGCFRLEIRPRSAKKPIRVTLTDFIISMS